MDQDIPLEKWEAKVSTRLEKARPKQVWPLLEDFFGLDKWFPGLATCQGLQGANGEPGCVRYCSGFGIKQKENKDGPQPSLINWSKERLVSIDRAQMTLTYEMVECNIGFESYVSTIQVLEEGIVVWWISLDPVAGWRFDDLIGKYEIGLKLMVEKMEAAIMHG